jgi:hypothetical protein
MQENFFSMTHIIPTSGDALTTWLSGAITQLSRKVAVSGVGVRLLDAQITHLENRCKAIHQGIDPELAKQKAQS